MYNSNIISTLTIILNYIIISKFYWYLRVSVVSNVCRCFISEGGGVWLVLVYFGWVVVVYYGLKWRQVWMKGVSTWIRGMCCYSLAVSAIHVMWSLVLRYFPLLLWLGLSGVSCLGNDLWFLIRVQVMNERLQATKPHTKKKKKNLTLKWKLVFDNTDKLAYSLLN